MDGDANRHGAPSITDRSPATPAGISVPGAAITDSAPWVTRDLEQFGPDTTLFQRRHHRTSAKFLSVPCNVQEVHLMALANFDGKYATVRSTAEGLLEMKINGTTWGHASRLID
jgi:hypothetical protein